MNKWQKQARFTLIVMGIALTLSLTAVGILRYVFYLKWHSAMAGFAFMALMALSRVHVRGNDFVLDSDIERVRLEDKGK